MAIKETIIETRSNKQIIIIDNLYTYSEVAGIYKYITESPFKIGNTDSDDVQDIADKRLACPTDCNALHTMKLFDEKKLKVIGKYISEEKLKICRVHINLGIRGDNYKAHSDYYWDSDAKSLLYYANKEWDKNWGGETVFFDDSGEEIEYVMPFIPGRLIIFNSDIPHMAKEQSSLGPQYRFTIAVKYIKPKT